MTTLLATASPVQTGRPGDRRLEAVPADSDGVLRPDLILVAAYLCVEGYSDRARERVLCRLADGDTVSGCIDAGALDPSDRLNVEVLVSSLKSIRGGGESDDFAAAMATVEFESAAPVEILETFRSPEEWAWRDARLAELNATMPADDDFPVWPA